jgi:uncharacterized protein YjbI with pentapeptide repeats
MLHGDLRGAKLDRAKFTNARLIGCRWENADFTDADLHDAKLGEMRLHVAGWRVVVRRDGTIKVGCVVRSAEQWAAMGEADIAALTPQPHAAASFLAKRDWVLSASMALRGLYR